MEKYESTFFSSRAGQSSRFPATLLALLFTSLALPAGARAQTAQFSYAQVLLAGGFSNPSGVAVDASGNVFVADTSNNAVKEIPVGCAASSCVNTLGSGFSKPTGVAVDASGDVFVADTGNALVKEMVAVGGSIPASSPTINSLGSGFLSPRGVAVDGSGNVYVADAGQSGDNNGAVFEILASNSSVAQLGSGFSTPTGVAVDKSGDVFVADPGSGLVQEIAAVGGVIPASPTITPLGSGFNTPSGVAVDGSGDVFVADPGSGLVQEIVAVGGVIPASPVINSLGSALSTPSGVAVDLGGDVFVADTGNTLIVKLETQSVDFGTVAVGQPSAAVSIPLTFIVASSGTIGTPVVLTQGATLADFVGAGTCTGTSYPYACTLDITFSPTLAGLRSGAVLLQDGSGNTIAMAYVHGIGSGPQVSFLPGIQSTLAGGFGGVGGVALDGSGNLFVGDRVNGVVDEIPAGGGTPKPLGGAFVFVTPYGTAVDGGGNVFVADHGNGAVGAVDEIFAAHGYTTARTLTSASYLPTGVALDGSGNVFFGDLNSGTVYEILAAGGYTTVTPVASGFSDPTGVAVDGSGNVFVADYHNNAVQEILAAGGYTTVNTLGGGFNNPFGVAVDAGGNVYVADDNNSLVKQIPPGCASATCVNTLGSGFNVPTGVAVDASGNVYVADDGNKQVVELDYANPPSLTFLTATPVGTVDTTAGDSPQTVTVQNIGNATLTFQAFNLLDAALASLGPADCTVLSPLQLASGTTCTLGIEFAPAAAGPVTGYVNVVDNALNAASPNFATQTITVQGTGIVASSTTGVALTAGANPSVYGSSLTFTATVTTGATGSVSFYLQAGAASCSALGASTLLGAPALSGGLAAVTTTTLPTGSDTVLACYGGDSNYNGSSGTVAQTVTQATLTIATEPTASPITYGQALSLSTLSGGAVTSNGNAVTGSFAFTTPTTTPGAGTPSESVTFTPTDTADYNTAAGSVIVTVNKATPTIATEPAASAITYGQELSLSTLTGGTATSSGNPVLGSFAFTTPTTTPGAGTPSESVTFTPTDTTDYTTATGSVIVTVNKATPTIATEPTASPITYGQALSLSTLTGGTATSSGNPVLGSFAFTTPTTTPGAGTPSESVTFTPTDTADYTTATGSVSVTVNKATPTIATEPAASPITYGQALSLSTLTGGTATSSGNPVLGSFAFTTPTTTPGAGTPSESVTFTPTDTTDYTTATGSVIVTVNKATPTIATEPAASPITYGQALSLSTLTGGTATSSGNPVLGSFAFTTPTTTPGAGTPSESVTFTPTDTADYTTATGSVSVTVNKATPTIATEPAASPITYGQALSLSTLTGGTATSSGNPVLGSFAFTTPTTTPGAGTPSESVTFTPTDTTDYTTATGSVIVTVNKATPTIATEPAASPITYGQALSLSTLTGGTATFGGNPVAGGFAFTTPTTTPGAGTPTESVTFTPSDTTDYTTASGSVNVTVNQAIIVPVFTSSLTQTYSGSPAVVTASTAPIVVAELSYNYVGINLTSYGPSATAPTAPGTYTVTVTVVDPNYAGTNSGTLTINQLNPNLTLAAASGAPANPPYGTNLAFYATLNPTVICPTGTVSFYVDGSATAAYSVALSTLPACTLGSPESIEFQTSSLTPGSHTLTATYSGDANYQGPATTAGLAQQIVADGTAVTLATTALSPYVGDQVTFTATVAPAGGVAQAPGGTVTFNEVDSQGNLITQLASGVALSATAPYTASDSTSFSPAGTYYVQAVFVDTDGDYQGSSSVQTVEAVSQKTPTINWTPTVATIGYGTALGPNQLNATATDPETGDTVPGAFTYTPGTGSVQNAGSAQLQVSFAPTDTTTYANNSATTTINVQPAALTVTPAAQNMTYGGAVPELTFSYNGFVNGDGPAVLTTAPTCTTTATSSSPVGSYPITCSGGAAVNYSISYGTANVTVNQATPTLTWATPAAITYGTALSGTQLDAASGGVAGSFVYAPALGTVLGVGVQTLKATFTPTDTTDYTTGTVQVSLTVNKANSTTGEALTAGTNPSSYGASLTFTATVTTGATGSVSFYLQAGAASCSSLGASTLVGAQTLSGGSAAVTTSTLAVGSDTVLACYSGDSNYNSSGGAVVQSVTETTTTAVAPTPVSIALGSSTVTQSLTATVSAATGTPAGTVTFEVGGVMVGTAPLSGGTAMWNGIAPTTANGFAVGHDTVTAIYTPATGSGFITSTGTQLLTVTAPAYTIALSPAAISLDRGGSEPAVLTLSSTTFADTTQWTATTSSPEITVIPSSGTATLSANGVSTANLTIMASDTAANHAPRLPWSGGLIAFGALLAGIPLAGRRKRVAAVLLTALAVSLLAFMMACGSSRAHTYTVTFTGTGGIIATYTVTVQ